MKEFKNLKLKTSRTETKNYLHKYFTWFHLVQIYIRGRKEMTLIYYCPQEVQESVEYQQQRYEMIRASSSSSYTIYLSIRFYSLLRSYKMISGYTIHFYIYTIQLKLTASRAPSNCTDSLRGEWFIKLVSYN